MSIAISNYANGTVEIARMNALKVAMKLGEEMENVMKFAIMMLAIGIMEIA